MKKSLVAILALCVFATASVDANAHWWGFGSSWNSFWNFNRFFKYEFRPLSSWGVPNGGVAEIVDATADGNTLVYTNSDGNFGVVDITDASNPVEVATIPVASGEPTSVAVAGNIAVGAVWVDLPDEGNPPPAFLPGNLVVMDLTTPASPVVLGTINIGYHPDGLKLVEINGQLVAVVAIENQPVVVDGNNEVTDDEDPGNPNDISPAGLVQVVTIDLNNVAASNVVDVNFPATDMTNAGLLYPTDPQPEFIDVHGNTAVATLQENNGFALIDISNPASPTLISLNSCGIAADRPADLIEDDQISFTETFPSGVTNPSTDGAGNLVTPGLRYPDAVAFSPNGKQILFADEGEMNYTGGRGWSTFDAQGNFLWEDIEIERKAVLLGHYPEGRSENKGIEMEGVEAARFVGGDFAFVLSERGSFMAVYRLRKNRNPKLIQVLPTGISPEGVKAIPSRNLVVTADEDSGTLTFFKGQWGKYRPSPNQPQLFNTDLSEPWTALSGLCNGRGNTIYAVPDNAVPTDIFSIRVGSSNARVDKVVSVKLNGTQARYDGEGICVDDSILGASTRSFGWWHWGWRRPTTGWWIASEGSNSNPNLLVQIDRNGDVIREIQLPNSIDPQADATIPGNAQGAAGGEQIRTNGFEGVCLSPDGRYIYACIQRDFNDEFPTGDRFTRIARYDLMQLVSNPALQVGLRCGGDWDFFFYKMDSNDGSNWAGLSEINCVGFDRFIVIERDKEIGIASALKKVYAFGLSNVTPDADGTPDASDTVTKHEVFDILGDFFPYEKVEGLALKRGKLWIGLDNDAGEVEPRLVNVGRLMLPAGL